jgi:hypothetical protein
MMLVRGKKPVFPHILLLPAFSGLKTGFFFFELVKALT